MEIILMRGLPGSGKSTLVKKHLGNFVRALVPTAVPCPDLLIKYPTENVVFSVDDYVNGEYTLARIAEGHAHCFKMYLELLRAVGRNPQHDEPTTVVVDNTNTTAAELAPYILAAQAFVPSVRMQIWHTMCSLRNSIERNRHDVPVATILNMNERIKDQLPPWYPRTEVFFTD